MSVPPGKRDVLSYRMTLGHKANHKFYNENVEYYRVDHPLWGDIVGLVASKPIRKGEEIFVNYGYHEQKEFDWKTSVLWYRKEYTNYIRKKLGLYSGKQYLKYLKELDGK